MRTNTATTIIAFLTAPFIAFRRAFFPKTAHPRRLDEARAQERGHSLAIYTLRDHVFPFRASRCGSVDRW